ncbi:DUF4265 domain-containing protein [Shewanella sp. A3A]|nr:DUF4265 domain-containing protein [Shewanella ferrihydritica]
MFKQFWQQLESFRCTYEGSNATLLSIDVPASTDIFKAYAVLESCEEAGGWEFEEAKYAHNTDA